MSEYEIYIAKLKEELIKFDFSDCPPVQQLADSIVETWLGQEEQPVANQRK